MKEFYDNLRQKREEKGITLDDIHQRSRLAMAYLQAIENGKIDQLPNGYERIYLKRYAHEIGLNTDEVLRDFDLLTGRLTSNKVSGPADGEGDEITAKPDSGATNANASPISPAQFIENLNLDRLHKAFWVGLAAAIVFGTAYFAYNQYMSQSRSSNQQIREIPISELIRNSRDMPETEAPQTNTAGDSAQTVRSTTEQSQAGITVSLRCLERTWIREVQDTGDTTEYILQPGQQKLVRANREVTFLLGRGDGVEVWLNNNNLGTMGAANQVVRFTLNATGVAHKWFRTITQPATQSQLLMPEGRQTLLAALHGQRLLSESP